MYVHYVSVCVCRVAELEVEVKHGADKMIQVLKENETKWVHYTNVISPRPPTTHLAVGQTHPLLLFPTTLSRLTGSTNWMVCVDRRS